MKKNILILVFCFIPFLCSASPFAYTNESEVGMLTSGGVSDLKTYNFKTLNILKKENYTVKAGGGYLLGSYNGFITNRTWDLFLKLERKITSKIDYYLGVSIKGNRFIGLDMRSDSDLGIKYNIFKGEKESLAFEGGYRFSKEKNILSETRNDNKFRLYLSYENRFRNYLSYSLWGEFIGNIEDNEDNFIKIGPNITIILNSNLSLKVSLVGEYDHKPILDGADKFNYLQNTSLIAKF